MIHRFRVLADLSDCCILCVAFSNRTPPKPPANRSMLLCSGTDASSLVFRRTRSSRAYRQPQVWIMELAKAWQSSTPRRLLGTASLLSYTHFPATKCLRCLPATLFRSPSSGGTSCLSLWSSAFSSHRSVWLPTLPPAACCQCLSPVSFVRDLLHSL